ncbi:hypothetical protein LWC35_21080 [Pseudonocardia kujensis]|uniref:hypothetical protein n=1 Tax=Pseudonocardia kujensis TaxID=1128675 RepID=UPI001E58E0C7|nr:hypothetical protein [Pseudonocardia kujensis]MCE0765376.1 hypothetical protein [Pseudonocardia kujensis]
MTVRASRSGRAARVGERCPPRVAALPMRTALVRIVDDDMQQPRTVAARLLGRTEHHAAHLAAVGHHVGSA